MVKTIFGVIEVLLALVMLVHFRTTFLGDRIAYPLDWLNPMVPAYSFAGGFVYGILSVVIRGLVLLLIILAAVGCVRLLSRKFR